MQYYSPSTLGHGVEWTDLAYCHTFASWLGFLAVLGNAFFKFLNKSVEAFRTPCIPVADESFHPHYPLPLTSCLH